ncbi:MAG: Hsp33 family molecular chaperone HslO [Bacilli bacterium]|jgi:molecular chaperone Hsp33|nr:Hsp33 family molecular chaperone HslO [Bacilli bacterium]
MAIRGLALNNEVRVYGINSTEIVRTAQQKLNTSACASAALGRVLSIVSLMGIMSNDQEQIIVTIDGNGPLKKIHAHYMANHTIRGYVDNPQVEVLINDQKKLNVKEIVGTQGTLSVMIKYGLKQDYFGMTNLISGEISEDFAYYFASSEQIPSVVSAGVLVDKDGTIISAGAIIFQLLPQASETTIQYLENCIDKISNISSKLKEDNDIMHVINNVFEDFTLLEKTNVTYNCPCTKEEFYYKIATLSIKDLKQIKEEDHQIEAICPWCNTKYHFNEQEIDQIIKDKLKAKKD